MQCYVLINIPAYNAEAELNLLLHELQIPWHQRYLVNQDSNPRPFSFPRATLKVINMALAVGDIFAIIDKSWALYEILRDSRSSNTQYRDLQNQLRSLYEVLLSVKQVQESGRLEAPTEASVADEPKHAYSLTSCIASIVQNCGETLDQLYAIFDKYRILGVAADSNRKTFLKVKQFIRKKEKEIQFTTEKEDLDSLRIQVQLHTNSLGVLLNLVIKFVSPSVSCQLQPRSLLVSQFED